MKESKGKDRNKQTKKNLTGHDVIGNEAGN